jgi:dGTPase
MQVKADSFLEDIFNAYVKNPEILPEPIQARTGEDDPYRVICDYIAGMTDRFALQEHSKLFDPAIQP